MPGEIVSPKVEVELTLYYQSQKGHTGNLTEHISRSSVMIDRTELVSSVKKIEEKIEQILFKINLLTEQICLLLTDNESKKRKSQELCTKNLGRGCKALKELHVYTQNQLEKLCFTYKILNLNDVFQQMNKPYSH